MVLDKLPVPGLSTIWVTVRQGPTALAVGAGGGYLDIVTLIYPFSPLSPSLWETVRYRLKCCHKGPINPKQPTNQPISTKCFILSKVYTDEGGIKSYTMVCPPVSSYRRTNRDRNITYLSLRRFSIPQKFIVLLD